MPSKDPINKKKGVETRPYTVFYVNPETPEEVHTDTIMAQDCEDASTLAAKRHGIKNILHVRGIGETDFTITDNKESQKAKSGNNHFPCARFINGEFLQATFSDDPFLDNLSDQS